MLDTSSKDIPIVPIPTHPAPEGRDAEVLHKWGKPFCTDREKGDCERLAGCVCDPDKRFESASIFPFCPVRTWCGVNHFPADRILSIIGHCVDIPPEVIGTQGRKRPVVAARRVFHCIARGHGLTLVEVAAITGHEHSSIVHSLDVARELLAVEEDRWKRSRMGRRFHPNRPFTRMLTLVWARCLVEKI